MIKKLIFFLYFIAGVNCSYYDFIPVHLSNTLLNKNDNITTKCFNNFSYDTKISSNEISLSVKVKNKKNIFCSDTYLISNNHNFYINNIFFEGKYDIFITKNMNEIKDIKYYGINIFVMNQNSFNLIYNILITINLFIDTSITQYLNLDFLKKKVGIPTKKSYLYNIPEKEKIKNGTTLGIIRYDGLDPLIMFGTGSGIGHTAVIYHYYNNTYVYESTDKNPIGKNYWPPPYGVIRTEFDIWIQNAKKANFMVNYFELDEYYQEIVNKNMDNFYSWFEKVKGSPYGTHNFINGWIDTYDNNYPNNLTKELLVNFISILYKNNIGVIDGNNFLEQDFGYAIKNRIKDYDKNFDSKNITEILEWSIKNNFAIYDLMILPELDSYKYNGKESMVCNVFVLKTFKILGLFDKYNLQVSEFTPKDLYQLKIWKNKPKQILGDYAIIFNQFNSIDLYDNMNEKCKTLPTEYIINKNC